MTEFDFSWPEDPALLPNLGLNVGNCLAQKGWCLINARADPDTQSSAVEQAQGLRFESVKTEFLEDLLGEGGSGKVCHLVPDVLDSSPSLLDVDSAPTDSISCYDRDITSLCSNIKPFTTARLGWEMSGRTEAMVWAPYASRREEEQHRADKINEYDVEDRLVETHLHFLRRRRLTCIFFIEAEDEELELFSLDASPSEARTLLEVSTGTCLIFCCDRMGYKFDPASDFLALQAWVLTDPLQLQTTHADLRESSLNLQYGIVSGPGVPVHDRACVKAVSIVAGGGIRDDVGNSALYRVLTLISAGSDGQVYVPNTRFNTDLYFCDDDNFQYGLSYLHHTAMIDDDLVMEFDNEFWGVTYGAVRNFWPKQRVALDVTYSVLYAAGWNRKTCANKNIPIFVGDCGGDWFGQQTMDVGAGIIPVDHDVLPGALTAMTAQRLAYMLNMRGACHSFDTACSSGLYAFTIAAKQLQHTIEGQRSTLVANSRKAIANIAIGDQVTSGPCVYIGNSAGHMLSHKGRCFTYDISADGYCRGEGCGAFFNERCKNNQDKIDSMGVPVGTCMNQDGRSASLSAPNGPSQQECTRSSMKESGMKPGEVYTCECHGTGTALGDPIEVGALIGVLKKERMFGMPFLMTSMKSNLGHQEENAGLIGLQKCLMINQTACSAASIHMRTLNPNLDVTGSPCLMTSDCCDQMSHTSVSSVSSFGFGGANASCTMWGLTKFGLHRVTRRDERQRRTITCPVTLGQIDHLTGEPLDRFTMTRSEIMPPAVLRDPHADYEISRYAYDGGFRLRMEDGDHMSLEDSDTVVDLPDGSFIAACGSWTGLSRKEEMHCSDDGWHTCVMALGETRCESFYLCVDGDDQDKRFIPCSDKAHPKIYIEGPMGAGHIRTNRWLIDGRDAEIPSGTVYKIHFRWGKLKKQVFWEIADPSLAGSIWPYQHTYSIVGSNTAYHWLDLQPNLDEECVWELDFRMGDSGQEIFHFVRDHDKRQTLYPFSTYCTDTKVPVRGPDDMGGGKYWHIKARPMEMVSLRLSCCDGQFRLAISLPNQGTKVFKNIEGYDRLQYHLVASWSDQLLAFEMKDLAKPGIFTCIGEVKSDYSEQFGACVEHFQVMYDQDPKQCLFPMANDADSGRYITVGPPGEGGANSPPGEGNLNRWMIKALCPGERFEVTLDLNAIDRRKMVTWRFIEMKTIEEQVSYFQQLAMMDED